MTHPLHPKVNECVRLLVEAGVLDGVECPICHGHGGESSMELVGIHGADPMYGCDRCAEREGDPSTATGKVAHPLRPLLVAQDAYGVEAGLTMPCQVTRGGIAELRDIQAHPELHQKNCRRCHGTGRVARTLDGWPESAVVGWVKGLCESVGWSLDVTGNRNPRTGKFEAWVNGPQPEGWTLAKCEGNTEAEAALRALVAAVEAQKETP